MTRNSNLWKHIFASCSSYSTTLGAHCRSRSFVDVNQSAGGLCDRSSDLLPQDGLNWRQHLLFLDKMALTIMHMMLLYANCPLPAYCQKVVDDESRKFVLWNTEGKKDLKNSVFVHKSIFDLKRLSWNDNALKSQDCRAPYFYFSLSLCCLTLSTPKISQEKHTSLSSQPSTLFAPQNMPMSFQTPHPPCAI